jgi:hypothetical protein
LPFAATVNPATVNHDAGPFAMGFWVRLSAERKEAGNAPGSLIGYLADTGRFEQWCTLGAAFVALFVTR